MDICLWKDIRLFFEYSPLMNQFMFECFCTIYLILLFNYSWILWKLLFICMIIISWGLIGIQLNTSSKYTLFIRGKEKWYNRNEDANILLFAKNETQNNNYYWIIIGKLCFHQNFKVWINGCAYSAPILLNRNRYPSE